MNIYYELENPKKYIIFASVVSESRFLGCMVGSAIGDALGAAFEGSWLIKKIEEINFRGRWTDDAHMMIGLSESLVANKGFDNEHIAQTFLRN